MVEKRISGLRTGCNPRLNSRLLDCSLSGQGNGHLLENPLLQPQIYCGRLRGRLQFGGILKNTGPTSRMRQLLL